ncbi:hypothetical protein PV327_001170 [Microctonus hyperodae]|uniref:Uncharacterized protein n=1 Tax=Microctonus hyperodae TaxID=165561 RepID=A0AA39L2X9_MICHY|nr:hypothetical protein PV327_001170 [Microctonus hyperodae]
MRFAILKDENSITNLITMINLLTAITSKLSCRLIEQYYVLVGESLSSLNSILISFDAELRMGSNMNKDETIFEQLIQFAAWNIEIQVSMDKLEEQGTMLPPGDCKLIHYLRCEIEG